MPDEKVEKNVKHLHLEIPADLHQRIKLLCVLQDKSMRSYTEEALREKVGRDDAEIKGGKENSK
jgi:hypothetical protein